MSLVRLKSIGWIGAALLSTATLLFSVGLLITSGALITAAAARPDLADLMLFFVAVRFWGLGRAALRYAERLLAHELVFRWLRDLRLAFFASWQRLNLLTRLRQRSGDILLRATGDLEKLQEAPLRLFLPWMAAAIFSGIIFLLLLPISLPAAGAFLAAAAWLGLGWPALCLVAHRNSGRRRVLLGGTLQMRLAEGLYGAEDLAASNAGLPWCEDLRERDQSVRSQDWREARWNGWQETLSLGTLLLLQGGFVVILAPQASSGSLSWPLAVGLILAAGAALEGFNALGTAWMRYGALSVIKRRLNLHNVEGRGPGPDLAAVVSPSFPAEGSLACHHVSVRLGHRNILEDVNLRLPEKGLVFLLGPSGEGKSTLLRTLLGLYPLQSGSLTVGDFNYTAFDSATIRDTFGVALQETRLLQRSLRDNLTLGNEAIGDDACLEILRQVGLAGRFGGEAIDLDQRLLERIELSGGELRRLGLARALLRPVSRIFVDEPFEHLDRASADRILALLRERAKTALVVVVTHHVPEFAEGDGLAYMEKGQLHALTLYPNLGPRQNPIHAWIEFQKDCL